MAKNIQLTLACGDYEITRALQDGTVKPDGIDLTVLTKMDSTTRHWRFLRNQDFDMAEVSCSSYILGHDRGFPFHCIPVFLHRRFRHGFIFINTGKGITKPKDLIGKKVGVKQFQATAVHWLRGLLEHEYGVPHTSIDWYSELDESVEFTPPPGLRITRLPSEKYVERMLAEGELDAVLHPDLIKPLVNKDPRVGRLFPDYKEEEKAFFKRTGIFPIMHIVGVRRTLAEQHPWLPGAVFKAFNESKAKALELLADTSATKVTLPFVEERLTEARALMGEDFWSYGLDANRKTLEVFLKHHHSQGLSPRLVKPEELFHPGTLESFKL
jgi:4,5-dihydroxyphthalate decarboxylase